MTAVKPYSEEIEVKMVLYYHSLSEKDCAALGRDRSRKVRLLVA
jgi:hypothetical protein